ncbi:HAD family hydrolase [Aminobacter aganoensis]|uniref:HAD superfamily hydrolase (TIGR01509 family) n=1 Tax=Aminobacter aganoensis TaxID=83264 RepID=A0A7X0F5Y1_9HYPH|nr:HAD family hydrolase [Aminobacter aganoensis]MBB6353590.1 HAD superfamily hydrolase (TIGR01509 family) [Aminobacter aganoensis]
MTQPELVIFDCDGVLVDSEIIAARIEAELLTAAGFEITAEEIAESYAGLTFKDIMLKIEEKAAIPFQASLISQAEELVDRRLKSDVRAIDGVHEAVAAVTAPRCICSNSTAERIEMMLERTRILPLFKGRIFSALETTSKKPKPAPDVFLHAASTYGADPAKTFVIEDSVHGISGAAAAGMRVIGFTGGAHSYPGHADMLTEAGAETVIRRWADLGGVLAALSMWSEHA